MHTSEAAELSHMIHRKMEDFKRLCEGLDEETASREPDGRWSPKEVVSHLCGPEGVGHIPTISAIVEEDTPDVDIQVEDPFFSERRAHMSFAELLSEFEKEYDEMAHVVSGLSEEQLQRKAHIPILRDTPLGEYPTLAGWVRVLGEHHLEMHIDHLKEILQELKAHKEQRLH